MTLSELSNPAEQIRALPVARRIRAIVGACSGNLVEWYDFFIYAYTAIYFASQFFPKGDQTSQLMATAGIFAVGFLMRPLGGWIFGAIADTHGRKRAMILSVFLMCAGSLGIAVIPTYESIGGWAPVLLLIARLAQGLSVGAEYGAGATYISEVSSKGNRAFYGSFQYATIIGGQLLALLTITVLQHLFNKDAMHEWGWRIPFFIGAISSVVVVYLRRSMIETLDSKEAKRKEAGSIRGLLPHKCAVLVTLFITMGCSLFFYTFTTYMQKFLVVSSGIDSKTVSLIMTSALVIFMLLQPVFGLLGDRIGTRAMMMLFGALAAVVVVPLMVALKQTTSPWIAFGLVMVGMVIAAFYTPVTGILKADLYPPSVRALGVGFPYAIGNALCGGTAEYVALWLRSINVESAFFYYVALMAALTFLAAWLMPDLRRHGYLDGDGQVEENTGLR